MGWLGGEDPDAQVRCPAVSASLTGGRTSAVESSRTWPLIDRIMLAFCWIAGISACVIAFAIVAFMAYKEQFALRVSGLIDKVVELKMLRLQGERLADIVLKNFQLTPGVTVDGLFGG